MRKIPKSMVGRANIHLVEAEKRRLRSALFTWLVITKHLPVQNGRNSNGQVSRTNGTSKRQDEIKIDVEKGFFFSFLSLFSSVLGYFLFKQCISPLKFSKTTRFRRFSNFIKIPATSHRKFLFRLKPEVLNLMYAHR